MEDGVPPSTTIGDLAARLRDWQAATEAAIAALRADRDDAEAQSQRLESPTAVLQYVDFFVDRFVYAAGEAARIAVELEAGPRREHAEVLRRLASEAAGEEQRCVTFRDKWINRILPYEQVRPLLNRIASFSRNRLAAFRELNEIADQLLQVIGVTAPPSPGRPMDRRALFNRILGRSEE